MLLETPGILWKLSTPRTGPYPVTNVYKNGAIRIQKGQMESMCNTLQDRNNNFGQSYYDSNYLSHVTLQLFPRVEYKIQL